MGLKNLYYKIFINKSLLGKESRSYMKVLFGITMYNEAYKEVWESAAGVYRAYYELVEKDITYENKVALVIIQDGYDSFLKIGNDKSSKYLASQRFRKAGLYDPSIPYKSKYFKKKLNTGEINDEMRK